MAKKFNDPSIPELDELPADHFIPVINPDTGKVNVITPDKLPAGTGGGGGTTEEDSTAASGSGFSI